MPLWYAYLKDLATVLTPLGVAWLGVRGSREFTAIREEVIKAKDAQLAQKDEQVKAVEKHLQQIRDLISKDLWEYLPRQKDGLEQIIKEVRAELDETRAKLEDKDKLLTELRGQAEGGKSAEALWLTDSILSDSIVRLGEFDEQLAEQDRELTKIRHRFVPTEALARSGQGADSNEQVSPDLTLGMLALLVAFFFSKKDSPDN